MTTLLTTGPSLPRSLWRRPGDVRHTVLHSPNCSHIYFLNREGSPAHSRKIWTTSLVAEQFIAFEAARRSSGDGEG